MKRIAHTPVNQLHDSAWKRILPECIGIPLQTIVYGLLAFFFVLNIVKALLAVAIATELAIGKAFAIQF